MAKSAEGCFIGPGSRVPEFDLTVPAGGRKCPSIGGDRHGPDFICVRTQDMLSALRREIPDADRSVVARGNQSSAIRGPHQRDNWPSMPFENADSLQACHVPKLNRGIERTQCKLFSVG